MHERELSKVAAEVFLAGRDVQADSAWKGAVRRTVGISLPADSANDCEVIDHIVAMMKEAGLEKLDYVSGMHGVRTFPSNSGRGRFFIGEALNRKNWPEPHPRACLLWEIFLHEDDLDTVSRHFEQHGLSVDMSVYHPEHDERPAVAL